MIWVVETKMGGAWFIYHAMETRADARRLARDYFESTGSKARVVKYVRAS